MIKDFDCNTELLKNQQNVKTDLTDRYEGGIRHGHSFRENSKFIRFHPPTPNFILFFATRILNYVV
jgi:hypothetical protein